MIPKLVKAPGLRYGILPPGIHWADLDEVAKRFAETDKRAWLFDGVVAVATALRIAGCRRMYLDGSFVTGKERPNDYDGCWDPAHVDPRQLDPVLLDFSNRRAAQKLKYRGEMFISTSTSGPGKTFLEFFQVEKLTGIPKGIVGLTLSGHENSTVMITNERQYRITKSEAERFRIALQEFNELELIKQGIDPIIIGAQRRGLEQQLLELETELAGYERLKSGTIKQHEPSRITEIGERLIEARIATGLSQKMLGERLGMREQQIQRYETKRYRTANLARVAEVAEALQLDIFAFLEPRGGK